MFDRRAAAKEAEQLRQHAVKMKLRRDKSLAELTALRGKASVAREDLALHEDRLEMEKLQLNQAERNAEAYENMAAGKRAFQPMPGAELPRAKEQANG